MNVTALPFILAAFTLTGAELPSGSASAPAVLSAGYPVPLALADKPVPNFLSDEVSEWPIDEGWPRAHLRVATPELSGQACDGDVGVVLNQPMPVIGYRGVIDVTFAPAQPAPSRPCRLSRQLKAAIGR